MPYGLPTLWELSEVFRHILMLHEPEVGSNYSGSVSLGTGLTSVLPGHGIIFIFRSDFQFGTVKHCAVVSKSSWKWQMCEVKITLGVSP